jgi:zinc protease
MKRFITTCAALALLVCAAGPRAEGKRVANKTVYVPITLENGLRVFIIEDHRTPTVSIVTWYRVGSKDEVKGKTGFAHLFEHMMFKGSAHVADGLMDELFEEAGGSTNAFTASDMTVYLDESSAGFLETALWLEADRIAGLTDTLDQAKLDNQREVVRNERRQRYENTPYGMASILVSEALWPEGHGYHWPGIGYHEDLVAASTDDVIAFFKSYYVPNNAVMVIAGDVDATKTAELVHKYLGWIPKAAEPKRPKYVDPKPIAKEVRLQATDDVTVPRVYLAWRGPKLFGAEEPALALAAAVLADGKTSRLYKRLVYEERLAQNVFAGLDAEELGGTFQIVATAKPGADPEKILAIITEEVAKLAKEKPTEEELERVKNVREAGFLSGLQDPMALAIQLAQYDVQAKDPNYLDKDLQRYRDVTAAQVKAAAKKWLPQSRRVVLRIDPAEEKPAEKKEEVK